MEIMFLQDKDYEKLLREKLIIFMDFWDDNNFLKERFIFLFYFSEIRVVRSFVNRCKWTIETENYCFDI